MVGAISPKRAELHSLRVAINLPCTYRKLHCKRDPYIETELIRIKEKVDFFCISIYLSFVGVFTLENNEKGNLKS